MLVAIMVNKLPSPLETLDGLNIALDAKAARVMSQNLITQELAEARKALTEAKNKILNEYSDVSKHPGGQKELGSNGEARTSTIDSMTVNERAAVDALENQLVKAQGELALAQIECDRWRYTLRILEVSKD